MKKLVLITISLFYFTTASFNIYSQQISAKAKGHFNKGLSAFKKERYEDALKEFEQAKLLVENWPEVYYQLGLTYEKLGMYDDAISSLNSYIRLSKPEVQSEIQSLMDTILNKWAEAGELRWIFQEYNLLPNHWSVVEDSRPGGGVCSPSSGNGYREVSNNKYEIKIFQGAGYDEIWSWVPIKFKDNFFEYTYTYYQCVLLTPEEARKELGMQAKCPWVINVKGEIIKGEPPVIKFTCDCEPQMVKLSKKKLSRSLVIKKTGFQPSPLKTP